MTGALAIGLPSFVALVGILVNVGYFVTFTAPAI
jgi:hypothetical protein